MRFLHCAVAVAPTLPDEPLCQAPMTCQGAGFTYRMADLVGGPFFIGVNAHLKGLQRLDGELAQPLHHRLGWLAAGPDGHGVRRRIDGKGRSHPLLLQSLMIRQQRLPSLPGQICCRIHDEGLDAPGVGPQQMQESQEACQAGACTSSKEARRSVKTFGLWR